MKAFWMAGLAIIVLAVAADYGLDQAGWSASERASGGAVRLK